MSTISALPPAPSRSDPATFSDKADALLGALDGFVSQTNVVVGEVLANKDTAVASAATATTQASNASTSASTATTQASNASSSASSASTSASTATTQAGIATAAASTATTQAGIATAAAASINLASPAAIGNVTPNTGAFTTLSASSTISGAGFTARFAAPGPIGSTTPSTGAFTTLSASGTVTLSGTTINATSATAINFGDATTAGRVYSDTGAGGRLLLGGKAQVRLDVNGAAVVDVSGTGIAVTGTTVITYSGGSPSLQVTGATTGISYGQIANAAGSLIFGVDSSTGGSLGTPATAYDAILRTAVGLTIGNGSSQFARFSSAGAVVAGAVTATTTINTGSYTVATLPAGAVGDRAYVTDATAPTFLGALTGGGAVRTPVFKNASAWVAG